MNTRLRLSRSDLLTVAGVAYRPADVQAEAITLERVDQPGITESFNEAAGFQSFLIDPVVLREAISLPEEGAVHPRRAARLLHLPAATITALIAHGHLDGVPVRRPSPARPQVYVCPHSIDVFQDLFISQRDLLRKIEVRQNFVGSDNLLPEHLVDLGEKTEPIYRREVLDFL